MQDVLPLDANSRRLELLLDRHLAGAASDDESAELRALYVARGGNPEWLRAVERYWNGHWSGEIAHTTAAREALLHRIYVRSADHGQGARPDDLSLETTLRRAMRGSGPVAEQPAVGERVVNKTPKWWETFTPQPLRERLWYATIATAVGVLGIVIGWNGEAHRPLTHTPLPVSTYATTNGQRATITLLDGTRVTLGVASRLDVPATFATGNRTVSLMGEALFMVPHHTGTPFTVTAGATRTRVLGTSFVVRHYPTDTTTMVAVSDGKVAVGATAVTAGRLLEIGRDGVEHMRHSDASPFSFATGLLTVNDMPLSGAIAELDRWFDVDIQLGDATLGRQRLDAQVTMGSLTDLTHMLEMAFDVRVVRNGRVLTLYPRH